MEKRQYYYLVAGLPDLVLDQAKLPFSTATFKEELHRHLHPEDYRLVRYLFLPADNRNLLRTLRKEEGEWDESGRYSPDELAAALREPELLPSYMQQFIPAFQQEMPVINGMSWENQLTSLYYDYVLSDTEGFLHEWFTFERDLRNLLAALSARRNKLSLEGQLIGDYQLTAAIRSSHARDFGVSGEYPYIERLIQWEDNHWLEREMALDAIRWNYIDELNTFHYFSVEILLGYLIKLFLLERWTPLDRAKGEEDFKRLVGDLEQSFDFPNEFAIA
jgi:hypothetical protein